MQAFQTHTATQPISIQLLQTQQKPHVTEGQHNAEKHFLFIDILHESCVLFAKMDQIFQLKKTKTLKKYCKNRKYTEKVREFCQAQKMRTMSK